MLRSLSPILRPTQPVEPVPRESASVALIFRGTAGGGEEILLIRRAEREGDPWTGQVAFPGGRVHSSDTSFRETAIRETLEEVGIDLASSGTFLGYMQVFSPKNRQMVVVPSVFFLLRVEAPIKLNQEEAVSHSWVDLRDLALAEHRSTYQIAREGLNRSYPSFVYRDYVIWGLTERILAAVIEVQGGG